MDEYLDIDSNILTAGLDSKAHDRNLNKMMKQA